MRFEQFHVMFYSIRSTSSTKRRASEHLSKNVSAPPGVLVPRLQTIKYDRGNAYTNDTNDYDGKGRENETCLIKDCSLKWKGFKELKIEIDERCKRPRHNGRVEMECFLSTADITTCLTTTDKEQNI